jgi:hypothetical protein
LKHRVTLPGQPMAPHGDAIYEDVDAARADACYKVVIAAGN